MTNPGCTDQGHDYNMSLITQTQVSSTSTSVGEVSDKKINFLSGYACPVIMDRHNYELHNISNNHYDYTCRLGDFFH